MKKNFCLIVLLALSLSVSALASGCGKKGPPRPPEEEKAEPAVKPATEPEAAPAQPAAPDAEEPKAAPAGQP